MGDHALPRASPRGSRRVVLEDIDFEAGVVHVRKGRKRISGRITIVTTKTPGSVRSLNSSTVIMDSLRTTRRDQRLEPIAAGWDTRTHACSLPTTATECDRLSTPR